jgi:hypothetical protein
MNLRRRKSKPQQAADLVASRLPVRAVRKNARAVRKALKATAAYQLVRRTPAVSIPVVLGAGVVAFAAAKLLGGGDDSAAASA